MHGSFAQGLLYSVFSGQKSYELRSMIYPYIFLGDFKLTLTLLGLKTTTSTYPWPYCFETLDKLKGLAELEAEKVKIIWKEKY